MEPSPNSCAGINCERYGSRLVRGMCLSHYNAWRAVSPDKRKIKTKPKAVGCIVEGCDVQLIQARGWCAKHYSRWQKHGDPLWEPAGPREGCDADGCDRDHYSLGYCVMHYSRLRNHGTPYSPGRYISAETCEVPECDAEAPRGRYCITHRARLTRLGTFDLPERPGRYKTENGYILVKAEGHALANAKGWVFEHRLVLFAKIGPGPHNCTWCDRAIYWERSYGDKCPDALVADHVDEDKENNDPTNVVQSCPRCNLARSSRWVKQRQREASAR